MPELKNIRHERFARAVVRLGNQRAAYIEAGYEARRPVVARECSPVDFGASRLAKHAKVKQRISELRRAMATRSEVTEDSLIDELEEARQLAADSKQGAAMVAATMGKARLTGLLVDRKEIGQPGDFANMTADELRAFIKANLPSLNADQSEESAKDLFPNAQSTQVIQ